MGEYQSWSVSFDCKKDKLDDLLGICGDFGIDIPESSYCETSGDIDMMRVEHYDDDTCSHGLYDDLVQLKEELIKAGAEDVSVKHTYPADLVEVESRKET